MVTRNPLLITSKGGTITCLKGDSGNRIYQTCSRNNCIYSGDLHTAKASLDSLEDGNNILSRSKRIITKNILNLS